MFSNNWRVITDTSTSENEGILITAHDDQTLVITKLNTSAKTKEFISLYPDCPVLFKYRCEIMSYVERIFNISSDTEKLIDVKAAEVIDKICEANRLLE